MTAVNCFESRLGSSVPNRQKIVSRDHIEAVADRVARTRINVLILGESGVGKEVLAERIHRHSSRSAQPMVTVDCAGLCAGLVESQLFGHVRGAFTGAAQSTAGFFEAADSGTLFLDEVGELPLTAQAKLLRVLETRTIQRLGSTKTVPVDVRFMAATNRDLDREVKEGRFRADLLFRIDGMRLTLAPLRDRKQEIVELANRFLAQASAREESPLRRLSSEAIAALLAYPWPGNIRELRNVIERAVALCDGESITVQHLALADGDRPTDESVRDENGVGNPWISKAETSSSTVSLAADPVGPLHRDRETVVRALERCAGNQTRAAALLGISRRTMVARIDMFGLPRPRKKSKAFPSSAHPPMRRPGSLPTPQPACGPDDGAPVIAALAPAIGTG